MKTLRFQIVGLVFAAAGVLGCSSSIEDGMSPAERDAARSIPGTGSAVATVRGVDYVGAFMLDVTGSSVSFQITGHDSTVGNGLSGRVVLPDTFSRNADGSIDFRLDGPADGSVGYFQINSASPIGYQVVTVEVRADATGLITVRLVGVRPPDNDVNGFEVVGTGGERETLTVRGHLTATCNVRLPSNDVIPDPEHTVNPLCAELLRGL